MACADISWGAMLLAWVIVGARDVGIIYAQALREPMLCLLQLGYRQCDFPPWRYAIATQCVNQVGNLGVEVTCSFFPRTHSLLGKQRIRYRRSWFMSHNLLN